MKKYFARIKNPKRLLIILIILSVLAEFSYWLLSPRPTGIPTLLRHNLLAHRNRLQHEKSPYLLQHADNPVDWYPWGEQAFQKARAEKKPVFISIGYAACHWCHVMEKESFENAQVAELLNKSFISVKVDREEHPDVDYLYNAYLQESGGQGGWPLTIVATGDGRPFFGATYLPRPALIDTLTRLDLAWKNEPQKVDDYGQLIYEALLNQSLLKAQTPPAYQKLFRKAYANLEDSFDHQSGGFGGAPKFPQALKIQWLLRTARRTRDERPQVMAEYTLQRMAKGAIFDQIGGGFHRYATDAAWKAPHFEKMLTDNALLAYTYLEAFQATGKAEYRNVAQLTLHYLEERLLSPDGGFYSSEDADLNGIEGGYYKWTSAEIEKALTPPETAAFLKIFELRDGALFMQDDTAWRDRDNPTIISSLDKLQKQRARRPRPFVDDKVLTAANGLTIAAFAKAYQVTGDEKLLHIAQRTAGFIEKHLIKDSALLRRYRGGDARYPGTLDDYAAMIHGLLHLYESDFNPHWIDLARSLQSQQDQLFFDDAQGGYFFTPKDSALLFVRAKRYYDDDKPNGMGLSAMNLLKLAGLTYEPQYIARADRVFDSLGWVIDKVPEALAQTLLALDLRSDGIKEIAVIENGANREFRRLLQSAYLPNKVLAVGPSGSSSVTLLKDKIPVGGKTTAYVCENQRCNLPTSDLRDLEKQISVVNTYALSP